jgi:hypothetical protein
MASDKFDLFGDPFDFNGDGKVDIGEEFVGFMMFQEMMKEEEESSSSSSTYYDYDDDDDRDYVTHPSSNYSSCTGSSRTASALAADAVEYTPPAAQEPVTPPPPMPDESEQADPAAAYQYSKEDFTHYCSTFAIINIIALILGGGLIFIGVSVNANSVDNPLAPIFMLLSVVFGLGLVGMAFSVTSKVLAIKREKMTRAEAADRQHRPTGSRLRDRGAHGQHHPHRVRLLQAERHQNRRRQDGESHRGGESHSRSASRG